VYRTKTCHEANCHPTKKTVDTQGTDRPEGRKPGTPGRMERISCAKPLSNPIRLTGMVNVDNLPTHAPEHVPVIASWFCLLS